MILGLALLLAVQEPVFVDAQGVMRWRADKREVALYGANYVITTASDYRAAGYVGADRKQAIDDDMAHFARMGWDGIRLTFWGDWEAADSAGNLIANDHLDLLDYLIARARERGIYMLFSPIQLYSSNWPDAMDKDSVTPGFGRVFGKARMGTDPAAIASQVNYLKQILNHVNPYTRTAIKNEPNILFVELVNEPWHHPEDLAGSIRYINTLTDAVRSTGCKKLVFYNVSQDFRIGTAIRRSRAQGITFGWYPTGLNAGHELQGNYLPSVDTFPGMRDVARLPRIVYEFDSPDLRTGYMYPAMARAFRAVGAQFAAMFAYDMLPTASRNLGWQTHYLSLAYTPRKAMSAVIAAEAMRRLPRLRDYGRYPTNTRFGDFRVSYEDNSSELVAPDAFLYAGSTRSSPPNPATLRRIAGYGSSPIVSYEGEGVYFLDRVRAGVWRLEVYPDAVPISDPFESPSVDKIVTRAVARPRPMTVALPDLGATFMVQPITAAAAASERAAAGRFTITPGVYVLSAAGPVDRATLPDSVGRLAFAEYHPPPLDSMTTAASPIPLPPAGQPGRLFDPGADFRLLAFTRIGDAGRRGRFRIDTSRVTGRPVFHFPLPVTESGWSPADYTASLVVTDRITAGDTVRIRLRGLGARQTLHVTLMEDDGTSWSVPVVADSSWGERALPLADFQLSRGVLLPQGFPTDWSYWVGPAAGRGGAGDRVRVNHVERLQLSLRRDEGAGVEIESVTLAGEPCCTATFYVRVPDSTGTVYLTGSLPELGPWRPNGKALRGTGRGRMIAVTAPPGTALEYKFTLGTWDGEALTATGSVPGNSRLLIARDTQVTLDIPAFKNGSEDYVTNWRGSGVEGRLVYWRDVSSAFLGPKRHVVVWLPPGYDSATATRYPVLYMHDAQNIFDPRMAFTGVDWGVDEAVMRLVRRGVIAPIIVVGVWNSAERSTEYSPWHDAPKYARFLIEELMPRVNGEFRTLKGPANTAVMGSSMGGLLSFYLVTHHPEAFGACGCISTHFPFSEARVKQMFPGMRTSATPDTTPYVVRDIAAGLRVPRGARYWFDFGSLGLDSAYAPTHAAVRAWLLRQGLVEGRDFVVRRYEGATHNEASWRARLEDPLTFLFGKRR